MYVAVIKLTFDLDAGPRPDERALASAAEKIRARFKVAVAALPEDGALAIAALGSSESRLSQTLDAIAELCERSGLGRVDTESARLDDLDAFLEDEAP